MHEYLDKIQYLEFERIRCNELDVRYTEQGEHLLLR